MPIGTPDFNQNISTNPTAPGFDDAENTTRILMGGGSQARSGRWMFATGFEEGSIPYLVSSASGTGGVAAITKSQTFQGLNAFELKPGNAVNNWSYLQKSFMYPGSKFGMEFLFSRQYALDSEFELSIQGGRKGVNKDRYRIGKIVLVSTTGTVTHKLYKDVNGTRTLLLDITGYLSGSPHLWHYIKFVYDLNENLIDYVIFDDEKIEVDSAGYEFASATTSTSFEVRLTNKFAGVNPYYYIDNLILSADEP